MTRNQIYAQITDFNNHINDNKETKSNKYYYMQDEEAFDKATFFKHIISIDTELRTRLSTITTAMDLAFGSGNLTSKLILENNISINSLLLNDRFLVDANIVIRDNLIQSNEINSCIISDYDFFESSSFDNTIDLLIFNPTSGGRPYTKDYNKNGVKEDLIATLDHILSENSIVCFNGKPEEFALIFPTLNCSHLYLSSAGNNFFIAYKTPQESIVKTYRYENEFIDISQAEILATEPVDLNKIEENIKIKIQDLKAFHDDVASTVDFDETILIDERIQNFAKFLEDLPEEKKESFLEAISNQHLTNDDINILLGRKKSLEIFKEELGKATWDERRWQKFFEENPWIFGYGLNYQYLKILQREAHISSVDLDGKNEVIGDFLMAHKFTVLVELKRPDTKLFGDKIERSETWKLSNELHYAVSQILAQKAEWQIKSRSTNFDTTGKRITEETYDPKTILIIGNTEQFAGDSKESTIKARTFELFRRNSRNIEILTFDELYERADYIVNQKNKNK